MIGSLACSGGFHAGDGSFGELAFSAPAAKPFHWFCHHGIGIIDRQPLHIRTFRHGENTCANHRAVDEVHFESVTFFKLRQTGNNSSIFKLCFFMIAFDMLVL